MWAVVTARLLDCTAPLLLDEAEEEEVPPTELEPTRLLDTVPLEEDAARLLEPCRLLLPPLAPEEPPDEEDEDDDDEELLLVLLLSSPVVVHAEETKARPNRARRLKWERVIG